MLAHRNSNFFLLFSFCVLFLNHHSRNQCNGEYLRVVGKEFIYDNEKVFLSGVNYAWLNYGSDFGNHYYNTTGPVLEQWVRNISNAGGNSLRFWLHVEGYSTPQFDDQGYVIAVDTGNTLISDLSRFLDVAEENNVFVIICLWNGALLRNDNHRNLIYDISKLQSYIDHALTPMVAALSNKPALAAWEIINEPEGLMATQPNTNPCFDTSLYYPGWTGENIPMETLLRFSNRQSGAIKRADPKALVTVSAGETTQSSAFTGGFNHYQDHCLVVAGGDPQGIINFYQMHTYSWEGSWSEHTPFKESAANYQLDKPLVIGEFSKECSEGETVEHLWNHGYDQGYDGIWSWQYNYDNGHCQDTRADQDLGMQTLRLKPGVAVVITSESKSLANRNIQEKSKIIINVIFILTMFSVLKFHS